MRQAAPKPFKRIESLTYGLRISQIDTHPMPTPAVEHFAQLGSRFSDLVGRALGTCGASVRDERAVLEAIGSRGRGRPSHAIMSHLPLRLEAAERLYARLAPLWSSMARHDWYFATFITDMGNSLEIDPVIELARLKRDSSKMMDLAGVDGVGVVDLQMAAYPAGGRGRTVCAHLHLIVCADERIFNATNAQRIITASPTFSNFLGAPVATFLPIPNLAALEFRCRYMFKAPVQESWLQVDSEKRSGMATRHRDIDHLEALRLAEILAHLDLRGSMMSRGKAFLTAKGDTIRDVATWQKSRPARQDRDYRPVFQRIWQGSRCQHPRAAPIIRTDYSEPIDQRWNAAMQPLRAEIAIVRHRNNSEGTRAASQSPANPRTNGATCKS